MINGDELAADLEECLKLAPFPIARSVIDRHLKALGSGTHEPEFSADTMALARLFAGYRELFLPERVQALFSCEVYVVPAPLCVAYAAERNSTRRIVIGRGLLNLICACSYWASFCESLPESLDKQFPLERFPRVSARRALDVFLFNLIYRHYRYGEPLPAFDALSPPSLQKNMAHALAGAVAFMLFHELGHLELGHLGSEHMRPDHVDLLVEQELTVYQRQEFEADEYALQSVKDEHRSLFTAWVNVALSFHIPAEIMLSEQSSQHPISVNRLGYAGTLSEGTLMPPEEYAAHLEKMGQTFGKIEAKNRKLADKGMAPLIETHSRAQIFEFLKTLGGSLRADGIELEGALREEAQNWTKALGLT